MARRGVNYHRRVSTRCHRCKTSVPEADIKRDLSLAHCKACGLIFDPTEHAPPQSGAFGRPIVTRRPSVPMPKGWEVDITNPAPLAAPLEGYRTASNAITEADVAAQRLKATARIWFKWSQKPDWEAGCWMPILVGALVVLVAVGIHQVVKKPGEWPLLVIILPISIFIVLIPWLALAMMLNATTITLREGVLRITHGPIPMRRSVTVHAEDIEQIFCLTTWKTVSQGRSNVRRPFYSVEAKLKGDREVHLMSVFTPMEGLYVEQLLEHALGIVDVALPGTTRLNQPQPDPERS